MKRARWSHVTIALAVIAAAAIATPAIGGQSGDPAATEAAAKKKIKKLVKKEVAKQLKGKQGPPGPPGEDGTALAGARVVGSDASFSPGTAFGGIEATKSAAGGYCIRVPFEPRNIVASTHSSDHYARVRLVAFGGGFGTCASSLPGHQAWVTTHLRAGGSFSDSDFFVLVN
jgi:hypothetical protein